MSEPEFYLHQTKAISEMSNGCILKGGVGVGKSITALGYYVRNESPRDIYIFTTAKKRNDFEWEEEANKFGISPTRKYTKHGVVKVDSWNNIGNYTDIKDCFVIFDEQRLVGNGAWVKAFYKIAKANRWIMLSATPGDVWMDYIPVFIANGFYKNRTEFIREHVVFSSFTKFPKVERYIETGRLEKYRRQISVEMPYFRKTKRHIKTIPVTFNEETFDRVMKKRWHVYNERPIRDVAELFSLMRKVVNSDVSRLGAVLELIEKHPRLIIFYNFDYELEMLRTLKTTLSIPVAEYNGHKHESIPDEDSWIYLVQYTAGAEGWNCVETNSMIFYSLNYSWRLFEQSQGRIDRLNTKYVDLYYYVLRSKSWIDSAIWKVILMKKKFNENEQSKKIL